MANKKKKFYVFNIKLQSDKKGVERIQAYEDLFLKMTSEKRFTRLNRNEAITVYKAYERTDNGIKYFYGSIGKGISFFDKDEIEVSDNNNISKEKVNKNKLYDPVTGDYIFIPKIHRFALLQKADAISLHDFNKFLQEHVKNLSNDPSEFFIVNYEKEPSIIEEIFKAQAVYNLSYEISYSNNDALAAQGELFDELLKKNHIGKLQINAKSDHSPEGMNINKVDFLGGGLEVAKSNGTIKSATIKSLDSKKNKRVSNTDKPLIQDFEVKDDTGIDLIWFKKLLALYHNV